MSFHEHRYSQDKIDNDQTHLPLESSTYLHEKPQYYKSKIIEDNLQFNDSDQNQNSHQNNKNKMAVKTDFNREIQLIKQDQNIIKIPISEIDSPEEFEQDQLNHSVLKAIYMMFCFISVQNNFATGVIPASLLEISKELDLNFSQQATLGSLEYLGISIATFLAPVVFHKYGLNKVISISVFFNGVFSLIISLSYNQYILYTSRFLQGFFASFSCIYAPIWINHFGPENQSSTWMGIMQSSGPLGVMIGYTFAALLITLTGYEKSWRICFAFLTLMTTITAIFFIFKDNKYIDILYHEKISQKKQNQQEGVIPLSQRQRKSRSSINDQDFDTVSFVSNASTYTQGFKDIIHQFGPILRNKIFIYVCLGICFLYYIVTGIQYWSTEYFIKFAKVPESIAMSSFSFVAITAPVVGALAGGQISDSLGGYKGKNRINALKYCVAVGIAGFIFSLPIGYVVEFWQIAILIWFLLAFGSSMIPNATGICLSCMPKQYHSTCSSLSQLIYNIGGYFMCPLISGGIMDLFDDQMEGLIWGWRSVLIMGVFGPLFFGIALNNEAKSLAEEEYQSQYKNQNKPTTENIENRTKAWSVM